MIKKIQNYIIVYTIGNKGDDKFNLRISIATSLILFICAAIATISNILIGLDFELIILTTISTAFFFLCYLLSRIFKKKELVEWLITLLSPVIINIAWVFNYGIEGPVPWLFIAFLSYLILVWENKRLLLFVIIVILNIFLFYLIESQHILTLGNYPSKDALLIDNYLGVLTVLIITYAYLVTAKKNYIRQYRRAKESDELKSAFLANVSHEIRTPLNAIVGLSNYILDEDISKTERDEYRQIIVDNGDYLSTLINDIIDISKIEANQISINKEKTELSGLFKKLEAYYQLELDSQGKSEIELKYKKSHEEINLKTDIIRLEQVLRTLLDNAIKFTKSGKIEIGCRLNGNGYLFWVKDTGIGIKTTDQEFIFNRFRKSNKDKEQLYRGTGIGLFLAQKLTFLLGGKIWVDSTVGKGSAFYFALPVE